MVRSISLASSFSQRCVSELVLTMTCRRPLVIKAVLTQHEPEEMNAITLTMTGRLLYSASSSILVEGSSEKNIPSAD
jgi:hypothetical protein